MWWIGSLKEHKFQVPQYFILQLVFQYIFHEGGSKEISCHWGRVREGFQRTFRRSILLFLSGDTTAIFWLFFFLPFSVKSRVSPDNVALSMTSHYCLDGQVPWMTSGLQTVSPLLRWLAPRPQKAAAGDGNSQAANFFCAAGWKHAALCMCSRDRKGGKGDLMPEKPWQCVGWPFFKICRRGPLGSARFLLPWSVEMWVGNDGPLPDSPEVVRFRMITPC